MKNDYEKKYNKFIKQIKDSKYHKGIFELLERLDGQIVSSEVPSKFLHLTEESAKENTTINKNIESGNSNSIFKLIIMYCLYRK